MLLHRRDRTCLAAGAASPPTSSNLLRARVATARQSGTCVARRSTSSLQHLPRESLIKDLLCIAPCRPTGAEGEVAALAADAGRLFWPEPPPWPRPVWQIAHGWLGQSSEHMEQTMCGSLYMRMFGNVNAPASAALSAARRRLTSAAMCARSRHRAPEAARGLCTSRTAVSCSITAGTSMPAVRRTPLLHE